MSNSAADHQTFLAILERVAGFTVGIAAANNTVIGTGTLISYRGKHLVLTAEHVIRGAVPSEVRFWCKPSAPLVEKPARDVTERELKKLTPGVNFPIETVAADAEIDLALLAIKPGFQLPGSGALFDLSQSRVLTHPSTKLDGLSLLCFGFPVDNARTLASKGNRRLNFLGCTSNVCNYDPDLNAELWSRVSSSISSDRNFLLKYNPAEEAINPPGFSGCGVWINAVSDRELVWSPEPLLIGMVHRYVEKFSVLIATNLSTVLDFVDAKV